MTNLTADIKMPFIEINHSEKRYIISNLKPIIFRHRFNEYIQNLLNDIPFEICKDPQTYLVVLGLLDTHNIFNSMERVFNGIVLKMKNGFLSVIKKVFRM
jgi:hypothetical protein